MSLVAGGLLRVAPGPVLFSPITVQRASTIAAAISPLGTRPPRSTSLTYPGEVRWPVLDGIRRAISRYDGLPARARNAAAVSLSSPRAGDNGGFAGRAGDEGRE